MASINFGNTMSKVKVQSDLECLNGFYWLSLKLFIMPFIPIYFTVCLFLSLRRYVNYLTNLTFWSLVTKLLIVKWRCFVIFLVVIEFLQHLTSYKMSAWIVIYAIISKPPTHIMQLTASFFLNSMNTFICYESKVCFYF